MDPLQLLVLLNLAILNLVLGAHWLRTHPTPAPPAPPAPPMALPVLLVQSPPSAEDAGAARMARQAAGRLAIEEARARVAAEVAARRKKPGEA